MTGRAASRVLACAAGILIAAGGLLWSGVAGAVLVDVPSTGAPGRLVLASDPYPAQFLDLSPGQPAYWHVEARLEDAERATLELEILATGALAHHPQGLTVAVTACPPAWTGLDDPAACLADGAPVLTATPTDHLQGGMPRFDLPRLTDAQPVDLLVTLAVADSPASRADDTLMDLTGDVGLGLTAVSLDGVDPRVPPATLPRTGLDGTEILALVFVGAGLLIGGLAVHRRRTVVS